MTLAQWYMSKAEEWAKEAEERRVSCRWMCAITWAQNRCATYAKLAQEAETRYGEAR